MQVGRAELVMVRLDAGHSPDIFQGIDQNKFITDEVNVSHRMRVHLVSNPPSAFQITAVSPPEEQQAVSNLAASTWMWNVVPKSDGKANLIVVIWALVVVDGKDTLQPLFQKQETISVQSVPLPPLNQEQFWDKVLDKIAEKTGEGIAAAIAAVFTVLIPFIWRRLRRKSATATPAEQTGP